MLILSACRPALQLIHIHLTSTLPTARAQVLVHAFKPGVPGPANEYGFFEQLVRAVEASAACSGRVAVCHGLTLLEGRVALVTQRHEGTPCAKSQAWKSWPNPLRDMDQLGAGVDWEWRTGAPPPPQTVPTGATLTFFDLAGSEALSA
jgi:hypothetical protein